MMPDGIVEACVYLLITFIMIVVGVTLFVLLFFNVLIIVWWKLLITLLITWFGLILSAKILMNDTWSF